MQDCILYAGSDASISLNGSMALGISKKGKNNPLSFAGSYLTYGLSPSLKAPLINVGLNLQQSLGKDWDVYEFGGSIGTGVSASLGSAYAGGGITYLLNQNVTKTSERSWADRTGNLLYFTPGSPLKSNPLVPMVFNDVSFYYGRQVSNSISNSINRTTQGIENFGSGVNNFIHQGNQSIRQNGRLF